MYACVPIMIINLCVFQLGDPTVEDHISSQYSSLDFDGISEYTQFFSSIMLFQCMCMIVIFLYYRLEYRGCMTRIIQQLSLMMPRTAAKEAFTTTQGLTMKPYESTCKINMSLCHCAA